MKFFDVHTHLSELPPEISNISIVSTKESEWEKLLLKINFPEKIVSLGIHPWFSESTISGWESRLTKLLEKNRYIGIGECGLDKKCVIDMQIQKSVFEKQVEMASIYSRPLSIHSLHTDGSILSILKKYNTNGIIHAFCGSLESAYQYISAGFKISFSPSITLQNRKKLIAIAKELPLNSIVVETDSPDSSKIDELFSAPTGVIHIIHEISKIRNEKFEIVADVIYENSIEIFST